MWLFSNSRSCPSFQKVASGRSNELDNFVSLFDESYNKTVKKGQMGLHKRFWNEESNTVCARYYTSEFMGKAAAPDILKMFKPCMTGLNDENISMDEKLPGVVACTCNPATLEAKFRNGVGLIPVGGSSPSIGRWIV